MSKNESISGEVRWKALWTSNMHSFMLDSKQKSNVSFLSIIESVNAGKCDFCRRAQASRSLLFNI